LTASVKPVQIFLTQEKNDMKNYILTLSAIVAIGATTFAQSGNVGIGTTTPSSKLTVNGNASVGNSFNGTAAPANGAIIQGNVGVGTATPTSHLHVVDSATGGSLVGSTNPTNIAFKLENVLNGQAMTQQFLTKNSSGAIKQAVIGVNPDWLGNGVFVIGRDGTTNDILVDLATGHTGMGANPDPGIRINLADSTGTAEIPIARVSNISPVAAGNKAIIGFNSYNGGGSTWGIGPEQSSANPYDSKFQVMSSTGGSYIRRMTFDQSGNVGIANINPVARLDVAGNVKIADGTQGAGKLLVSDANGLASWQSASTAVGASSFWNTLGNAGTAPATNFIGTTDNQGLAIRTNNTEKVRIAPGGNVGIGTTAPLANTHIVNAGTDGSFVAHTGHLNNVALRLEGTGNNQAVMEHFVVKNSSGVNREFVVGLSPQGINGDGVFVMARDTQSDFLMDMLNGHVGVGVFPSVHTRLDVGHEAGTAEFPIVRVSNISTPAAGNTALIGFNSYNGGGSNWGAGSVQNSTSSADSKFHIMWSGGGNYNRYFTISPKNTASANSLFNVGINTASPNNTLDLGTAVGSSITDVGGKKLAVYNDGAGGDFYGLGISANALQFHAASTPAEAPGMILTGTGLVGISTTSPNSTLDLGTITGSSVTDVAGKKLAVYNNTAGTDFYGLGVNTNSLQFHASSTASEAPGMVLRSDGNVGIGNTAPTVPLDIIGTGGVIVNMVTSATSLGGGMIQLRKSTAAVNGDVWANFIANGATVGYISSNAATTIAYNTTSDVRLKENIENTHFGISDVMKIDVKDYNYKADKEKTPQTGFLAQQLYKVFPVAVTQGDEDVTKKPWAVDYGKVTPLLTKAIQDQQNEIESLKGKIIELTAKNEKLSASVEQAAKTEQHYAEQASKTEHSYSELAQQVKEMQQMLGISKLTTGAKVAGR
jgi:hypothetical protein